MTAQTIGLLLFTGVAVHGTYLGDILLASLLVAIGIGLSFVPATIAAVAGVARAEAGLASGLVNTARMFGGALGLAVLAAIATAQTNSDARTGASAHAALTSGFQVAFVVCCRLCRRRRAGGPVRPAPHATPPRCRGRGRGRRDSA